MRIHDGAYGTLLRHHLHGDETVDDLCLREPALVVGAHRAYLDAGATAIQANSFLAHLRGSSRRRRELRTAALACAREAAASPAGEPPLVLATIGPAGDRPRDFWEAIEHALDADAAGVLCETVTTRAIADAFVHAWAEVAAGVRGVEVLLGCSTDVEDADASSWVVELAGDAPDEVLLGLNCCSGPTGMRGLLERVCEQRGGAFAMPSAGLPQQEGTGLRWPFADPHGWADAVREQVAELPVVALGGCCGTTPDALAAVHAAF